MRDFLAHCEIVNGKLQWKNEDYLNVNLPKFEGMRGTLTIKKKWNKRSLSQNALLWIWYEIIGKDCGMTAEETHIVFKGLYSPRSEVKMGKLRYMIPRSTTTFTKGEMVEYMFHVEKQAAELYILLPHPEDLDIIEMLK